MSATSLEPIGVVRNDVTETRDEDWGGVVSEVRLEPDLADGLLELQHFSHAVVVFLMHQARFDRAAQLTRHPRDRTDLPLVEDSPRSPAYPLDRHLFAARADRLAGWDDRLAARVTRESLGEAIAHVPDDFLIPLLGRGPNADRRERRRRAYHAFLWKRLKAPRPFVTTAPAATQGTDRP